ncbi:MAG: M24 family metallopeptidase [Candidatus Dormibacteraceae bacterium]
MPDWEGEAAKARGLAPRPPARECSSRLTRARAELAGRGLDGILIYGASGSNPEPVRYLAGYVHVYPSAASILIVPAVGAPILLIDQPWHVVEARKMSWVDDIRPFPHASRRWMFAELRNALAGALRSAGLHQGRLGIFEGDTPEVYAAALREAAPGVHLEDARGVWEALVASPSDHDLEMIQRTAAIADEGQAAAARACAPGRTEQEACLEALAAMAAMGAEFLHGSGLSTHVNIGSFSDCVSNVRPFLFTARRLERGHMFWFDLSASYAGYYVDCCRTISLGAPTPGQARIHGVASDMYRAMLAAVRPGMTGNELWSGRWGSKSPPGPAPPTT